LYLIRFPVFLHSPLTSLSYYPHLSLNINLQSSNNLTFWAYNSLMSNSPHASKLNFVYLFS
jgi:hypothetical protein